MPVTNNNLTDYGPTGTIFLSKLTNLLASSTSPKAIELRRDYREELDATPSNTYDFFRDERDAYLDAKKALDTPAPAEPAPAEPAPAKKGSQVNPMPVSPMPPGFRPS